MLNLNDKLRLITEGYSIEEINAEPGRFENIISENAVKVTDELAMILESANVDLDFIQESAEVLNESALSTLMDKVKRFIAWITEKINNIIKWVKERFKKKGEQSSEVVKVIEEKIKTGELKDKIEAIKEQNEEKYEEAVEKHEETKPAPKQSEPAVHNEEPAAEPAKRALPDISKLKITLAEKVVTGNVGDVVTIAKNIASIVNTSLKNMENFRMALIRGTSNAQLNSEDNIANLLVNLSTGNKVKQKKDLRYHITGNDKEYQASVEIVSKVAVELDKMFANHKEVFEIYEEIKSSLSKLRDESESIIQKYKNSAEVREETITRRVSQMIQLITTAVAILNDINSIGIEVTTQCSKALDQVASL